MLERKVAEKYEVIKCRKSIKENRELNAKLKKREGKKQNGIKRENGRIQHGN